MHAGDNCEEQRRMWSHRPETETRREIERYGIIMNAIAGKPTKRGTKLTLQERKHLEASGGRGGINAC